jgi:hypothetical protein
MPKQMIMPQLKYEQKKKVIQAEISDSFMGCDLGYICGGHNSVKNL